jgi:hypothetical protein
VIYSTINGGSFDTASAALAGFGHLSVNYTRA